MLAKFILAITPLESVGLYQGWTWLRSLQLPKAVVSLYTSIVYIHIYTYWIKITNIHWVHLKMVLLLETTLCEACLYSKGMLITVSLYGNRIYSVGFASWCLFLQQSVQCRQILFTLLYREFLDVVCFISWCDWHLVKKWLDGEGIDCRWT